MAQRRPILGNPVTFMMLTVLLALMFASPALCAEQGQDETITVEEQETPTVIAAPHHTVSAVSGYRFITPDGPMAAASPYGRLKSGVTGGFTAASLGQDLKLTLDSMFRHEDDHHAELFLDYAGQVRFHAESGALWHNLLREQITPGTLTLRETDSGREYGTRSATTQVDTRIRLGNYPLHLNLGYWELKREGYEQLRFSDYYRTGASTIVSEASRVERITREGSAGLDAHLGLFDLSYGFSIRDFSNQAADNRFLFTNTANGTLLAGVQAHDVIPDSRVTSHTIKLFTNLSGGLVGTAAYTLTRRENNGGHGDATPSSRPTDTIQTAVGDMSYTPFKELSLAIKYRHQEISRDSPATVSYPFAAAGTLQVRPATDTLRDTLNFSTTLRPTSKAIYRLEYQAELESRNNVWNTGSSADPAALHSDSRQTHTGKASFYWKPYNAIKLNASYSYATSDNQYYGSSFADRHTGKLLITYTCNGKWGLTGSYLTQYETGEGIASTVSPAPVATYPLPRESHTSSTNTSFWFSPAERLTITTSYSYLEADASQSLLFYEGITDPAPLVASNYRSSAHVYGIDAAYAIAEPLDVSLAFQQVRSKSRFEVPARTFNSGAYSTDGITGLTRLDATETGVSARVDWRFNRHWSSSLDSGYRLYDAGNPLYDGSVYTTMLFLKARW